MHNSDASSGLEVVQLDQETLKDNFLAAEKSGLDPDGSLRPDEADATWRPYSVKINQLFKIVQYHILASYLSSVSLTDELLRLP